MSHWLQGEGVGPCSQLRALARIRAADVLPTPAGSGEQVGVADAVGRNGVGQGLGHVFLADQVVERLRAVSPGDDDVLAGATRRR